jgi:hypothetical protein
MVDLWSVSPGIAFRGDVTVGPDSSYFPFATHHNEMLGFLGKNTRLWLV